MSAPDLDEFKPPIIKTKSDGGDGDADGHGEVDVGTPKTPEHVIQPMLICPPAPRKPARRRVAFTCKRKFRELKFLEMEEIESFFRRAEEEVINGGPNKKRCVM